MKSVKRTMQSAARGAFICISCLAAAGQTAQRSIPRAEVNVTGIVLDATAGLPIPNATVECGGGSGEESGVVPIRSVTTGPDGRFSFERVPEGAGLRAWRRGYRTADEFGDVWTGHAGRDSGPFTVRLVRLGVVTGRVRDEHGDPILGLTVQVLKTSVEHGKWRVRQDAIDVTDDNGAYRLWHINPGSYYLQVRGRRRTVYGLGEMPAIRQSRLSYGPAFYPSGTTLEEAQRIRVEPGSTLQADFTLQGQPGFTIRGQLRGVTPGDATEIDLLRGGEITGHMVRIEHSSGVFEIADVAPGDYALTARSKGKPERFARAPLTVGSADLTGVIVSLQPGATVRFLLKDPEGWDGRERVMLLAEDHPVGRTGVYFGFRKKGEEDIKVEGVPPGRYRVLPDDAVAAASIRSGLLDLFTEPLVVSESGCEPVEIQIASQPGRLEVEVSGLPAGESAVVLALRDDAPLGPFAQDSFRSGKSAVFPRLAPGLYRIFAYLPGTQFAFNERGVVQSVAGQSVMVAIAAGATEKVTVRLLKLPEGGLDQ